MNSAVLRNQKSVHLMLVISILATFFVMPVKPVSAGFLSSLYSDLGPLLRIGAKIGGAVVGASLCSAFVPPLGIIAGAIGGWMIGSAIGSFATGSITNLGMLAGGAVGAMAMGPGFLGTVGGFLIGAIVAKVGIGILREIDCAITGGVLLNKGSGDSGSVSLSPSGFSSGQIQQSISPTAVTSANVNAQTAEANYRKAYQEYISATSGGDASKIKGAHENYINALREYKAVVGSSAK
ncbi:MAG: hypothetical protein HQM10_17290 [Candidatus Riflebacteria bacterium]|nr:hypothetical protein [Candidatus Riflebacteria bacterium]